MTTETTTLTGSERQVSWATRIIREFAATINAAASKFEAAGKTQDGAKLRAGVETLIAAHTDAGWWIDHDTTLKNELRTVVMGS